MDKLRLTAVVAAVTVKGSVFSLQETLEAAEAGEPVKASTSSRSRERTASEAHEFFFIFVSVLPDLHNLPVADGDDPVRAVRHVRVVRDHH